MIKMRILRGSDDFFTGKSQTTTQISPAQEEAVRQLNPIKIAFNKELSNILGFSGGPDNLTKTGPGVGGRLADTFRSSSGERNLPGLIDQAFGRASSQLSQSGAANASRLNTQLSGLDDIAGEPEFEEFGEFDTGAILQPLFRQFEEQILPGIRSRALQFGAPSGSREGEVIRQNTSALGETAGNALARQELARRGQVLESRGQNLVGRDQSIRARNNIASFLPQLFGFETANVANDLQGDISTANAGAGLGLLERELAGRRELAPFEALLQALGRSSPVPFQPAGSTTRSRDSAFQSVIDAGTLAVDAVEAFKTPPKGSGAGGGAGLSALLA